MAESAGWGRVARPALRQSTRQRTGGCHRVPPRSNRSPFVTTHRRADWYWIVNAIALGVTGVLPDKLRVRRPFHDPGQASPFDQAAQAATVGDIMLMVAVRGGRALSLPFVFVLSGRWSPRRAEQDELEHEQWVADELAALQGGRS
jgi:hypothetical protein